MLYEILCFFVSFPAGVSCSQTSDCSYVGLLKHLNLTTTNDFAIMRPVKNWTTATLVHLDMVLFGILQVVSVFIKQSVSCLSFYYWYFFAFTYNFYIVGFLLLLWSEYFYTLIAGFITSPSCLTSGSLDYPKLSGHCSCRDRWLFKCCELKLHFIHLYMEKSQRQIWPGKMNSLHGQIPDMCDWVN